MPNPCDGDEDDGDDPLVAALGPGQPSVVLRPSVIDAVVGPGEGALRRERSSWRRSHREPVSCASAVEGAFTLGMGGGGLVPVPSGLNAEDAARRCSDDDRMLLPELAERGCDRPLTDDADVDAGDALRSSAEGAGGARDVLSGTAVERTGERT